MSDSTVKTNDTGSQERLASHTPGPWRVNQIFDDPMQVCGDNGKWWWAQSFWIVAGDIKLGEFNYCTSHEGWRGEDRLEVAKGNAALAAAAPELFDTLKQFALWADTMVMLRDDQKVCGIEVRHFRRAAKICNSLMAGTSEQRSTASAGPNKAQAE